MGVSFPHYGAGEMTTEYVMNQFKNDSVYKECCYPIKELKQKQHQRKDNISKIFKNDQIIKNMNNTKLDNNFLWTKVYRSPVPNKQIDEPQNGIDSICESLISRQSNKASKTVKTLHDTFPQLFETQASIASIVNTRTTMSQSASSKKNLFNKLSTKVLCPCCTGGDDGIENAREFYDRHNATNSYETIDLSKPSDYNVEGSIKMDTSRISTENLHKEGLSDKRKCNNYQKVFKAIASNTYKNLISLFHAK